MCRERMARELLRLARELVGANRTQVSSEWRRVFPHGTVYDFDGETFTAEGDGSWPNLAVYDADLALRVLRKFPDEHGLSERGDAEVSRALEKAGAFEGFE